MISISIFLAILMASGHAQAQPQEAGPINPDPTWAKRNAKMIGDVTSLYAIGAFSGAAWTNYFYLSSGNYTPIAEVEEISGYAMATAGTICGGLTPIVFNRLGLPELLANTNDGRAGYALVTFRGISQYLAAAVCSGIVRDFMYEQKDSSAVVAKNELINCTNRKIRAGSGRTLLQEEALDDSIIGYDWWSAVWYEEAFRARFYIRDYRLQKDFLALCNVPGMGYMELAARGCYAKIDKNKAGSQLPDAINWSINARNNSRYQAIQHHNKATAALGQAKAHLTNLKIRHRQCEVQREEL